MVPTLAFRPSRLHCTLKTIKPANRIKGLTYSGSRGKRKQDGKEPTPARVGAIFNFQRGKFFFHIHSPCRGAALFLAFSAPILLQDSEFCKGGGLQIVLHLHRQERLQPQSKYSIIDKTLKQRSIVLWTTRKKWSGDEPQKDTAPPEATKPSVRYEEMIIGNLRRRRLPWMTISWPMISLRFRCRRRSLVRQSLYLLLPPRQTAVKSRSPCVRHP